MIGAVATGLVVYVVSEVVLGLLFTSVVGKFGIGTAEDDLAFVILYMIARFIPAICAMLAAILMTQRSRRAAIAA